jgi:hypothetical protein
MKLRCLPPSFAKGLSALTTPAPLVQRLPAPPASVTTPPRRRQRVHAHLVQFGRAASRQAHELKSHRPAAHPRSCCARQPILRQADAPAAQVGADLLVLHAIEAVGIQQRGQTLHRRRPVALRAAAGQRASAPCRPAPAACGRPRRKRSSSARRKGESVRCSWRSNGARSACSSRAASARCSPCAVRPRCRAR